MTGKHRSQHEDRKLAHKQPELHKPQPEDRKQREPHRQPLEDHKLDRKPLELHRQPLEDRKPGRKPLELHKPQPEDRKLGHKPEPLVHSSSRLLTSSKLVCSRWRADADSYSRSAHTDVELSVCSSEADRLMHNHSSSLHRSYRRRRTGQPER